MATGEIDDDEGINAKGRTLALVEGRVNGFITGVMANEDGMSVTCLPS